MTIAVEFNFYIGRKNASGKVQTIKNLYGHKNVTRGYTYLKDGMLSNMKHIRPTKSTIILKPKDAKELKKFFMKKDIDFRERTVILDKKEEEELEKS